MAGIKRCVWDNRWTIDFDLEDFQIVMLMLKDIPTDVSENLNKHKITLGQIVKELYTIGYEKDKAMKLVVKARQELEYERTGLYPIGWERETSQKKHGS